MPTIVKREARATWLMRIGFALAALGLVLEAASYLVQGSTPSGPDVLGIPLGALAIVIAGVGLGLALTGYALAGGL